MKYLNQQLLKFDLKQNYKNEDFYVNKSNFFAFSLIEKWPKWEKNILNIHGEKYCGKTHLSNIFKQKNKAIYINEKDLNDELLKKLKVIENIILDNYENLVEERLLYSLFNLVDVDNKFLIINSIIPINEIKYKLQDLNSRCKNCLFAKIDPPDDDLIFALILKNFSDRQIKIEKKTNRLHHKKNR